MRTSVVESPGLIGPVLSTFFSFCFEAEEMDLDQTHKGPETLFQELKWDLHTTVF